MDKTLERVTFTTSRALEFFTEKELSMQIGLWRGMWPLALVKELIDNGLDACENAGIAPELRITVRPDSVSVWDNGPGLPLQTLEKSLDYSVRVSDKAHYVSPTRGQLGNALKCVWAAPFVISGERGHVDVTTGGTVYNVDVTLDRIAQAPRVELTTAPDGLVKTGTLLTMAWPRIAGYLNRTSDPDSYTPGGLDQLIRAYGLFNPHVTIASDGASVTASAPEWHKWRPNEPTSPHWYTAERLRALIAAYLSEERAGARPRTVREFVAEFAGLSGSAKQKAVTNAAGMTGAYLHDLIAGADVAYNRVEDLLAAIQAEARVIKPDALGVIGEDTLRAGLAASYYVDPESVRYKRATGLVGGLPYALEVAFGILAEKYQGSQGERVIGLNWSPALNAPIPELAQMLGEARVDGFDPVTVAVHLACPRLDFTDRGKSRLALPADILGALAKLVKTVTADWKQAKRQGDRQDRVRAQQMAELRKARRRHAMSVKDAAYAVMPAAYMAASGNGAYPANARQVMYAARPAVLRLTGGKCWENSSYFTQHLLPDYMDRYPEVAASWDVVFDNRGRLFEPHTACRVDIGTLAVRDYVGGWMEDFSETLDDLELPFYCGTKGPANRYRFALFVEKEGFAPLFERARLAERYDLAIMSTKGMSVTAARQLVETLSGRGVAILVLHDFDKAGFSILHTLRTDTRRYHFQEAPNVIDLGLRIDDVRVMDLQSEPVSYQSKVDPRDNLRECGATTEECDFLVRSGYGQWSGQRVELNAMTSGQFLTWLEGKLAEHGVKKVVPYPGILAKAYRRAWRLALVERAIEKTLSGIDAGAIEVPEDLPEFVGAATGDSGQSWDLAIWELARREVAHDGA